METPPVPEKLQEAAEVQLQVLDGIVSRALKWPRRIIATLGLVIVLLIGSNAFTVFQYMNQIGLTNTVSQQTQMIKAGSIRTCELDNARAAADLGNWEYVLGVSAAANKNNPTALSEIHAIENHVVKADSPKNCAQEFGLGR